MFGNYNMGAGFALYTPEDEIDSAITVAAEQGLDAWYAGPVEKGSKQVVIEPLDLVFPGSTLGVR